MSTITVSALKKQISNNDFSNLYFLFGDEKYLIEYYTEKMKNKILNKGNNNFNLKVFNSDIIDIDELQADINALPFMCNKKCIVIKNLNVELIALKQRKELLSLISDIPDYCTIIFSFPSLEFSYKKSAKWKSFLTEIKKHGTCVEFKKLTKTELKRQLVLWAKSTGKKLSDTNAEKIINICSNDLLTLRNELHKLCAYTSEDEITESIINKIITKNEEATVFELCNELIKRNCDKALQKLNILFFQREDPIAILSVISSSFIDLYRAKVFTLKGKTLKDITNSFNYNGKEFKIKNAISSSKSYSKSELERILNLLLLTDKDLKSSMMDKEILLQKLIVNICMF